MRKGFTRKPQADEPATRVKNYITRSGLQRLKDEHRFLLTRERPAVTEVSRSTLAGKPCPHHYACRSKRLRYLKGSIVLSETHDYPLLRQVLHCTFVTPDQLFQLMRLDYCASSRTAFDNRLRRLLAHQLLLRHDIATMSRGVVYSISPAGASEL